MVVAFLAAIILGSLSAQAQGLLVSSIPQPQFNSAINNSIWAMAWGSDSAINTTTNGTSVGYNSSPFIAGGATYTSDIWNMALTFNSGNVSVSATSASAPGLFWSMNYSLNSLAPVTSLLLGANYQASNGESLTIGSINVNNIPLGNTAPANATQSFSGLLISYDNPIVSLNYTLSINTPSGWERQNLGQPALLSTVGIPSTTSVPEPSTNALIGLGILLLIKKCKCSKK